jgi:hypothetical protein
LACKNVSGQFLRKKERKKERKKLRNGSNNKNNSVFINAFTSSQKCHLISVSQEYLHLKIKIKLIQIFCCTCNLKMARTT